MPEPDQTTTQSDDLPNPFALLKQQVETANEIALSNAERDKKLAELEKERVLAERATVEAKLPQGGDPPLEGTIAASENSGYLATLVAYRTLQDAAVQIAAQIERALAKHEGDAVKLYAVSQRDVVADELVRLQVTAQLEALDEILKKAITDIGRVVDSPAHSQDEVRPERLGDAVAKGAGAVVTTALSALTGGGLATALSLASGTVAGLASIAQFFNTEYTLKGRDIAIDSAAAQNAIIGQLLNRHIIVERFHTIAQCTVVQSFVARFGQYQHLSRQLALLKETHISPREIAIAEKRAAQAKASDTDAKQRLSDGLDQLANDLLPLKNLAVEIEQILTQTQQVTTTLTTSNEGATPLAVAAHRQALIDQNVTHLLHVDVLSSGGEVISKKRLFRPVEMSYVGGVVISYVLAEVSGRVVAADTITSADALKIKLNELAEAVSAWGVGDDRPKE